MFVFFKITKSKMTDSTVQALNQNSWILGHILYQLFSLFFLWFTLLRYIRSVYPPCHGRSWGCGLKIYPIWTESLNLCWGARTQTNTGNQKTLKTWKLENIKNDPWDMLNNFCFHVYAQKSLFIVENDNGFFLPPHHPCLLLYSS